MDNRKWVLTGSSQTSQHKPESGSSGSRILEIWWEDRNRLGLERRARTSAPVRDGAGSKGINYRTFLSLPTFVQSAIQRPQSA